MGRLFWFLKGAAQMLSTLKSKAGVKALLFLHKSCKKCQGRDLTLEFCIRGGSLQHQKVFP